MPANAVFEYSLLDGNLGPNSGTSLSISPVPNPDPSQPGVAAIRVTAIDYAKGTSITGFLAAADLDAISAWVRISDEQLKAAASTTQASVETADQGG